MDEKRYSVKLADGTTLENLKLNGNNFISEAEIDPAIFEANCSPVVINDGESDEKHENMELVHMTKMGAESWFALRDLTVEELEQIKLRSDVEYIAMMAGVEL